MATKFKIKKGDSVVVITGRDKGKSGEVLRVLREESRVVVQGVNIVKRHTKPSRGVDRRHRREGSGAPHLQCRACRSRRPSKPTRVGYKVLDDGRKVRVARSSGEDDRS